MSSALVSGWSSGSTYSFIKPLCEYVLSSLAVRVVGAENEPPALAWGTDVASDFDFFLTPRAAQPEQDGPNGAAALRARTMGTVFVRQICCQATTAAARGR